MKIRPCYDRMKKRFDVREVSKALEAQQVSAQHVAREFAEDLKAGKLSTSPDAPQDSKEGADGYVLACPMGSCQDNICIQLCCIIPFQIGFICG